MELAVPARGGEETAELMPRAVRVLGRTAAIGRKLGQRRIGTEHLLPALLELPAEWHHGYDLSRRTGLRPGTLHPVLLRLADQDLLEARWVGPERPGRPPRHVYRLTGAGRELARSRLAARPSVALRLEPTPR